MVGGAVFVDRENELAELRAGLGEALDGTGRLFLISGEPGVGKTSLADALCAHATSAGAGLLWGRCWEGGGAPPYWPWIQVLRHHVRTTESSELERDVGDGADEIVRLVPELHARIGGMPEAPGIELEGARFALFEAVTDLLRRASARRPLVLILDDVHAADIPSLLLLRFVARDIHGMRALVVGTYREVEARLSDDIRGLLGEIAREGHTLPLRGFAEPDVASLVEIRAGAEVPGDFVTELHTVTGGNPFFVDEIVRLLAAEESFGGGRTPEVGALELPHGVSEVIGRRLQHVSETARAALEVAAVAGREFRLDVVATASDTPLAELVDPMDDAVRAGVVTTASGAAGSFTFVHALIREKIYSELRRGRRIEVHRRIGEALETLQGEVAGDRLAELAHHFNEAAWAGQDVEKAVRYSLAAGQDADRRFAFEDAVEHYQRALQALQLDPAGHAERRCDVLLALGDTQWRAASTEAAKATFEQASALARRLGSPERMARAALGFGGRFAWVEATGAVDVKLVELLRAALDSLPPTGSDALRARLLGRLATQLYFSPEDYQRAHEISGEAVELARRSGDVSALAYALNTRRFVMWGKPVDGDRLALSRELLDVAQAAEDTELILRARGWLIIDHLELADLRAADRETRMHAELTAQLRQPLFMAEAVKFRAMWALMEGRLADAEALGQEFAEKAQWIGDPDIAQAIGIHMFLLRGMQARSAELEAAARTMAEQHPLLPAWRCGLAFVCAETGKEDEARQLMDTHIGAALELGGHAGSWVIGACVLAELSALLAERGHAERLYDAVAPFAGTNVVIGYAAGIFGAADRTLGLLAATLGRLDDAERHLERALELNLAIRAKPFTAWTKMNLAMVGLAAGSNDHRIERLLGEALALGEEAGAHRLARGAKELLARGDEVRGAAFSDIVRMTVPSGAAAPETVELSADVRPTTKVLLVREGEFWTVGDEASPFRLKDSKGLHHLAQLISAPGTEWFAADLVAAETGSAPEATMDARAAADAGLTATHQDDAGAGLDEKAKEAYRERLQHLREDLEEAESFGDPERASAARAELDFLAQELSAAVGLGGRDRKAASTSERARVNVTRLLRSAIARIRENDESLGQHLEAAVKTGTFCSYAPEPWSRVEWRLGPDA